jgi:hypothetical protein
VPFTTVDVGADTLDGKGNACATLTETETNLPVDISPPAVLFLHIVAKDTEYDPALGIGDGTFTSYFGGKCNGASFDNTGATIASTGTYHYAASERGKRLDFVLTSLTNPAEAVGDFSISGSLLHH